MLGGFLYRYLGGKGALQVFSSIGVICSITHLVLHKTLLRHCEIPESKADIDYKSPADAVAVTDSH